MSAQELWQWVHYSYGEELGLNSSDEDYVQPSTEDEHMFQSRVQHEECMVAAMEGAGVADKVCMSIVFTIVFTIGRFLEWIIMHRKQPSLDACHQSSFTSIDTRDIEMSVHPSVCQSVRDGH